MPVNIKSIQARALIASQLGGERFDKHGMDAALAVTIRLIDSGQVVTDCPDSCGGAA